jgi:hypothetical protein
MEKGKVTHHFVLPTKCSTRLAFCLKTACRNNLVNQLVGTEERRRWFV